MDQQIEQAHPEVVEIGEQIDFFAIARKVLPWVVLAFVLFRVGALVVEFQGAQQAADRQAASDAAATTLTAAQPPKGTPAASPKATPAARGPYVVVLSDGVNFHASASNSGKVLTSLKRGDELAELGRVGNWLRLKDSKGTIGYVYDNSKFVAHKE
jgi:hypothetical protein